MKYQIVLKNSEDSYVVTALNDRAEANRLYEFLRDLKRSGDGSFLTVDPKWTGIELNQVELVESATLAEEYGR